MRVKRNPLAAAGVALALMVASTALLTNTAGATTYLSITLSASGTGASAMYNSAGDPVLTVGSPSSTTYAEIQVNDVAAAAPNTAPTFTTDNYSAGSPHWEVQFADGDSLYGYPGASGLGSSNWQVVAASSGPCAGVAQTGDTYAFAVAFIQNSGRGGNVTAAFILADGNQVSGTSDTITAASYDGETLDAVPDVVTVTNPGSQTSTVGTAITLQVNASSNDDTITSYIATGLPDGLSINSTSGAITGTPTTAGPYSVTVSATDSAGTDGSASFSWTVSPAGCPRLSPRRPRPTSRCWPSRRST